ncbi:hypothetical protein [Agrobacterium sp. NPDC090273]|uniref:hypothetical protein n=1 Tax=Agrobacterium sp. NPDC090273 TaxID=3363919 RepID=UPI00383AFCF4
MTRIGSKQLRRHHAKTESGPKAGGIVLQALWRFLKTPASLIHFQTHREKKTLSRSIRKPPEMVSGIRPALPFAA